MGLKKMETVQHTIGEYDFYIRKFGAFNASNISVELLRLFTPIVASIVPTAAKMLMVEDSDTDSESVLDKEFDFDSLAPALAGAFSNLTGEQLEHLMKQLLIDDKNISFVSKGCMDANQCEILSWNDADEIFCGDIQDMYMLAIKVIQVNYSGFFTKLAAPYGLDMEKVGAAMMKSRNMAALMSAGLAN